MRAYAAELMHRSKATEEDPVFQVYMAGQRGVIRQDDVVTELAIMRDVHVRHDPVVATQAGNANVLCRPQVDGDEFTYRVAVA
ncbi:hypothetical protein D3C81_2014450 [compost metagenome]